MKTRHNRPHTRARIAILAVAMVLAAAAVLPARGSREADATVTVVGRGEVSAEPDQANITVGVQLYHESAQHASAEIRERMDAVIEALRAIGIADREIQTMNYSIHFERDYQAPPVSRDPSGTPPGVYRVENMVRIMIGDVTRAAEVVEAAISAGANQMYGIQFSFSDPAALDSRARSVAMADARLRAGELATEGGRSLGPVLEISEQISTQPEFAQTRFMADGYGGGPVQPGTSRYSAAVRVTYRLK